MVYTKDTWLDTEKAKEELGRLEAHLPHEPEELHEFGRYLAGRMKSETSPVDFGMFYALVVSDLQRGNRAGFSGEPQAIKNDLLVGKPHGFYLYLLDAIPRIAGAVFPTWFAEHVRRILEE